MISLHHDRPCMPKEGWETYNSVENRTTPCTCENTGKPHSKKKTTQANVLATISQQQPYQYMNIG